MAVDTNGDIIVADYDNRWVSIFSPEGKFKVRSLMLLYSEPLVTCSTDHARSGPKVVYHQLKVLLCCQARALLSAVQVRMKSLMVCPSYRPRLELVASWGPKEWLWTGTDISLW